MKFYLVIRPSMRGTTMPVYHYTFAKDEADAIFKIEMKWGGIDNKTIVREITGEELDKLIIATDYFG